LTKSPGPRSSIRARQRGTILQVGVLFSFYHSRAPVEPGVNPCGARDEFYVAAIAQNLRKLAKLIPGPQTIPAT
jgi:hypothetical protein